MSTDPFTSAGLAALAAASPKPDDADAELIRLCDEATRCEDLLRHIDAHGTSDERCATGIDDWERVFGLIAETRATTIKGLQAKARALRMAIPREALWSGGADELIDPDGVREDLFPDGRIALSLASDILAMGGQA